MVGQRGAACTHRRPIFCRDRQQKCVSSLTTAIEKNDPALVQLPTLIQIDEMFEDDEDG